MSGLVQVLIFGVGFEDVPLGFQGFRAPNTSLFKVGDINFNPPCGTVQEEEKIFSRTLQENYIQMMQGLRIKGEEVQQVLLLHLQHQ